MTDEEQNIRLMLANALVERGALALDAYLRDRAAVEGVGYAPDVGCFESQLRSGTRTFFGIAVDNTELLPDQDDQEPHPGFLENRMNFYMTLTDDDLPRGQARPPKG